MFLQDMCIDNQYLSHFDWEATLLEKPVSFTIKF